MSTESINKIKRIIEIYLASEGEVRPHCIVTGPSGSGKSHNIEALCTELDVPLVQINAAGLTKEGTAGNSLSKALAPLVAYGGRAVVCFVDEFDKLFISGNSNSALAHETTNGVQNEFLKVLEGVATISADYGKYHTIKSDNVLFIFAGAFNGEQDIDLDRLREMGIKTEFLGRVGLVYGMEKVTLEGLHNILVKSPLLGKYLELHDGVKKETVVDAVMAVLTANYEKNDLGVRMVTTLLHQYFIEGSLTKKEAVKTMFQRKLAMPA
jgi:ATP-dependent protease Clp ATPase subunit